MRVSVSGIDPTGTPFATSEYTYDLCGLDVSCGVTDPETCTRSNVFLCNNSGDDLEEADFLDAEFQRTWLPLSRFPPDVENAIRSHFPSASGVPIVRSEFIERLEVDPGTNDPAPTTVDLCLEVGFVDPRDQAPSPVPPPTSVTPPVVTGLGFCEGIDRAGSSTEDCCNGIDDNYDGLVDFDDATCCDSDHVFPLDALKVNVTTNRTFGTARGKVKLSGKLLPDTSVEPLEYDVTVRIESGGNAPICATIPSFSFVRPKPSKPAFVFKDEEGEAACFNDVRYVADERALGKGAINATIEKIDVSTFTSGPAKVDVRLEDPSPFSSLNLCYRGQAVLVTKRNGFGSR